MSQRETTSDGKPPEQPTEASAGAPPPPAKPQRQATAMTLDHRTLQAAIAFVFILGAALGAAFWILLVSRTDARDPHRLLMNMNLGVSFPSEWHEGSGAEVDAPGFPEGTGFVYRGEANDPDLGLFIAARPLGAPPPAPPDQPNAGLLNLSRIAEQGAVSRIVADGGRYRSDGCAVTDISGRHVGVCSGTAGQGGDLSRLRLYLVLGAKRAIMALSLVRGSTSDPREEIEAIVAQLTP